MPTFERAGEICRFAIPEYVRDIGYLEACILQQALRIITADESGATSNQISFQGLSFRSESKAMTNRGRPFDSRERLARYSPITPSEISCTEPRNKITSIIEVQPGTLMSFSHSPSTTAA